MPQSIERVLYTPHRSAAGFLAACVDGRLLCMSLYCRGGATVCSMFDPPADVFAERADHSRRARSRPCPSAHLGPVGHGCANPAQQLTVEHLGARVNCANSRRGCSGGHSSVQHIDLVFEFLRARRGAVAHVHILGDKAQRLRLAATADQDRLAPNRNLCVPNL